jgi:hypothetical protein
MEQRNNPESCYDHNQYMRIFESDLPEIEKIAQAFGMVTGQILDHGQKEMELFKSMGDQESLVKEQIKLETIRFTRGVFNQAFTRATGRSAWDE